MVRKSAWFLNFDAEEELARGRPRRGRGSPAEYTPSGSVLRRFEALIERVRALLSPLDVIVPEGGGRVAGEGFTGMAWCPTPRALRALGRAGVAVPPAPPVSVLRAVNHRQFSAGLGQTLPLARFAVTRDEVMAALAGSSPHRAWLLKRPLGFAGRGRLRVEPDRPDDLRRAQAWIEASLGPGEGLQVEPFVERLGDFALHGFVRRSGAVVLGAPTRQACDASGAWLGSARAGAGDLDPGEERALFEQAERCGEALHRAGYFGPFGVDAYRYLDARAGALLWNPRSEINARYSMGWAVGMGDVRPDLED